MIKNIIWDFDGTLFDTYPAITRAFQQALLDFGYDMPEGLFFELVNVNMDHCIEQIATRFSIDPAAYLDRFRRYYRKMAPDSSPPFPGAEAVCKQIIARGGQNFIATHRRKASATELLTYFKMTHLFSDCLFGDDDYPRKPDPAMFNHLVENHELDKEETLAAGDRALDIQAGKAAGIATCLYLKLEENLQEADCIVVNYENFMDLFESDN